MELKELTENVEIVQTLGVYPNQENGLAAPDLQQKFDEGNRIIKQFLNEQVVPAHNQLLETVARNKKATDDLLNIRSQGQSAKYNFTTPGWKRVLNIIRGSGGMLNFCFGQSAPLYMAQVAGIVFSGFVKYGNDTSTDSKPVIYQMYNNIFGEDDALENPGSITKVRIGYPDPDQENYDNGTNNAIRNPINCYLDVYVDFDKDALNSGDVGFQMNYAGFADSHNCEAITREKDAVNVGIYGEKLLYHELTLDKNSGIYMPGWGIHAEEISADSMRVGGKKVIDAGCVDSTLSSSSTNPVQNKVIKAAIDAAQKKGTSQMQFAFKSSNVSTPLLFAGISTGESTAYLKDPNTKTPFLDANGEPIDKKEAGAYVMAGVYGDIKTGTLHAKSFDAETEFKVKGNPIIDDTKIDKGAWSSKNTVDKLCPGFTESGAVAVCDPVEGYPLDVISEIAEKDDGSAWNSISLTQCGKNLFSGGRKISFKNNKTIILEKPIPAGTYFISIKNYTGSGEYQPVIIPQYADGTDMPGYLQVRYNPDGREINPTKPITQVRIWSNGYSASSSKDVSCTLYDIQIEPGTAKMAYEEYKAGMELTVNFANLGVEAPVYFGSYNWQTGVLDTGEHGIFQHDPEKGTFTEIEDLSAYVPPIVRNIPAMSGTNCFYSNCGDTAVKGKSDPVKIIEKLTTAILAIGGTQ